MRRACLAIAIFGLLTLLSRTLGAQTFLLQPFPEERPRIGFRFLHPSFTDEVLGGAELTTLSGAYEFSVSAPVGSDVNIVGAIPFANLAVENGRGESDIGDVYIGIQTRYEEGGRTSFSFGAALPTAPEEPEEQGANATGALTDWYELHKFLPKALTIYGNFAYQWSRPGGGLFGVEGGPQIIIPVENTSGTKLFGHYGVAAGVNLTHVAIFAEVQGVVALTTEGLDFSQRFDHFLAFGGQVVGHAVRPGVFYQIPIDDDFGDILDGLLGVKVEFSPQ